MLAMVCAAELALSRRRGSLVSFGTTINNEFCGRAVSVGSKHEVHMRKACMSGLASHVAEHVVDHVKLSIADTS